MEEENPTDEKVGTYVDVDLKTIKKRRLPINSSVKG